VLPRGTGGFFQPNNVILPYFLIRFNTLKSTARGSHDKQNCLQHSPPTSVKKRFNTFSCRVVVFLLIGRADQQGQNTEGITMRKIMGNKPQVSSAIIIYSRLQISWNDLLHQGQTADVSIIRAKTGTFIIETLDVQLAP
jgi:hypothetical protein